jgi:ATP-dependent Clp protease ATP-binding subunit ClpC
VFERFTDRARRVVVLAQEEARLLNHNYIGTEHILLGLIHEGEGVAAKALESLGISLEAVRAQVEEIIGQGQSAPTGHIPFTPRAKKVLELSLREALELGHNYIGTEHILLGLLREGEGVAAQVLVNLGASLDRVRQVVIGLLSGYPGGEGAAEQAGARTRLVRMTVPAELREAEEQLAQVRREKQAAVDRGDFEQAAGLREKERRLLTHVAEQERAWTAGLDLAAVLQENQHLHRELERLRELLGRHGIEPDGGTTATA